MDGGRAVTPLQVYYNSGKQRDSHNSNIGCDNNSIDNIGRYDTLHVSVSHRQIDHEAESWTTAVIFKHSYLLISEVA